MIKNYVLKVMGVTKLFSKSLHNSLAVIGQKRDMLTQFFINR